MKILLFSDIHADWAALRRLMSIEADLYFCAGDLVNWAKGLDQAGEIMRQRGERVWMIPGTHESAGAVEAFCEKFGFVAMHGRSRMVNGVHIAALGYSNPTPFDTPGEYSEMEIARRLEEFAPLDPLVLVCHCPPKDTALDRAREGAHFGSTAVREFVERVQPREFFCGHIHEAHGAECAIGKTRGRNLGKQGYLLELTS
jgi:uncharacterized protein